MQLDTLASKSISKTLYAFSLSAMVAAECLAFGRHGLDSALEAVKGHRATTHRDLKGLIVVVSASVAFGHWLASEIYTLPERATEFSSYGATIFAPTKRRTLHFFARNNSAELDPDCSSRTVGEPSTLKTARAVSHRVQRIGWITRDGGTVPSDPQLD